MGSPRAGKVQRAVAYWGFYGLGVIGSGLAVLHVVTESEGIGTILEAFIIGSVAAVLFYTGWESNSQTTSPVRVTRAVLISVGTGGSFALLAVGIILIWRVEGHTVPDKGFILAFASVLGLAVGGRSGHHSMRMREEVVNSRELVKLLTINQRVLRHNLRNELAIVSGLLDNLADQVGTDDSEITTAKHHIGRLVETSDRARRLVRIGQEDVRVEQDVEAVLANALEALHDQYPEADVAVEIEGSTGGTVVAHPALVDAFSEAFTNAVEHNDPGIEIVVSVTAPNGATVVVEIADTGDGTPSREREILFQAGEGPLTHGRGLGLWLIYWIVTQSGGTLTLEPNVPTGSVIRMRLPSASDPSFLSRSVRL